MPADESATRVPEEHERRKLSSALVVAGAQLKPWLVPYPAPMSMAFALLSIVSVLQVALFTTG